MNNSLQDPTDGKFRVGINVLGKAITAVESYAPAYRIKQKYDKPGLSLPPDWPEHLPDVSKQSDVLWIFWKDAADDDAKDLK